MYRLVPLFIVTILFLHSTSAHAQYEARANCIKKIMGVDANPKDLTRIDTGKSVYTGSYENEILKCMNTSDKAHVSNSEIKPNNPSSTKPAIDTNELAKARAEAQKSRLEADKTKAEMEAYKQKYTLQGGEQPTLNIQPIIINNNPSLSPTPINQNPTVKTSDAIFVDDVQSFFTGGGNVDVVTFVPLLQAAKQKTLSNQPDSSQAVDALKEHLNSNSAFQIFYTQLTSRRADERKQEKEKLLLTVKNAEKSITDYIRANLNDPNLNQYLDALKIIGVANSDTSSDELKIILNKLSALNPSYAQLQSSNGNTSEQKSSAQIQIILPTNTKLSNDDFNSIFPNGIYAKTEKDCARYLANPKQMLMNERFERVTIQGKEISRYSTGGCTVRNITGADPAYIVSADCTEEGETSNQKYSFSIRNGKFNFGQFDEMGKNWWSFCSPIKPSANNATPQSLLPNKNIFENLDQTKFDNTNSDINKPQIGINSNSISNEQNLRLQMDIYKRISSKKNLLCNAKIIRDTLSWNMDVDVNGKDIFVELLDTDLKKIGYEINFLSDQSSTFHYPTTKGDRKIFILDYKNYYYPLEVVNINESSCRRFK